MTAHKNFAGDAVVTTLAAIVGRAIALVNLVVTMRLFPADVYGLWVLVLTFANFVSPLATLRLEVPLVMARTERMTIGITSIIASCTAVVAALLIAFSCLASSQLINALSGLPNDQSALMLLVAPALLLLIAQQWVQSSLMRVRKFRLLGLINVIIPVLSLFLTVALPHVFPVSASLAAAIFLISTGFGVLLALPSLKVDQGIFRPLVDRYKLARVAFGRFSTYPKYTLPFSLSFSFTERITQLVLAHAYSVEILASYFVARQMLSGLTSVISGSLRNVFFAHSASDRDRFATRGRALRILKLLGYLVAPALAFGYFRVPEAVDLFAGKKWPLISNMIWFWMFPAAAMMFSGVMDRTFDLVGRQHMAVILQLASDGVLLAVIIVGVHLNAPINTIVALTAGVIVVYNLIWLIFSLMALEAPLSELALPFIRFGVLFFGFFIVQWAIAHSVSSTILSWAFAIVILMVSLMPALASIVLALFPNYGSLSGVTKYLTELP